MPEEQNPAGAPPAPDDPYSYEAVTGQTLAPASPAEAPVSQPGAPAPPSSGSGSSEVEEDDDDEGMLRMSFLEHLEELRARLLRMVYGLVLCYACCLIFANRLWEFVRQPVAAALVSLGYPPNLKIFEPMDGFLILYIKLPLLAAIFLASPWLLWQVWSFIAPGLYKKERRFAGPFVVCTAGLFVCGGLFAYFVAFRLGLAFLLGIGGGQGLEPNLNVVAYFDLFVNVTLGLGVVFELPILIFFLIVLGVLSPKFLLDNSRYAILGIVVLAAVVTPTPDAFNLTIFAVPMIMLYFVGVFAGWIFVMRRDGLPFPWAKFLLFVVLPIAILAATVIGLMIWKLQYKLVPYWPFLTR